MADLLQSLATPSLTSLTDQFDPSEDDLMLMKRVLGAAAARPDLLPTPFLAYLSDYLQAGDFSVTTNQIAGFARFTVNATATVPTQVTTTSGSYGDLAGSFGPEIDNLPDGNFLVVVSAYMALTTDHLGVRGNGTAFMSPSANGATPVDNDAAITSNDLSTVCLGMSLHRLSNGSNRITAKYKCVTGDTPQGVFAYRNMFALRYANL